MSHQVIAIIGAGNVGSGLAKAFTSKGQVVMLGVSDPNKYQDLANSMSTLASVTSIDEAIAACEVIILAIPYAAALTVAATQADWGHKILVDATNPLMSGLEGLSIGTSTSAAEEIAKLANGALVVKAFNTTGAENLADSNYQQGEVFMPVCGNDQQAKNKVITLAKLIGFDAVDVGELKVARYLEPFAMTWIHMAIKMGQGRQFAFGRLFR